MGLNKEASRILNEVYDELRMIIKSLGKTIEELKNDNQELKDENTNLGNQVLGINTLQEKIHKISLLDFTEPLGRKITSLTLMTIMLAGGMTFAVPGVMPAAHAANETLFVSAENSVFENSFGGTQVIEIVVSDPLIASLDNLHDSPNVKVNDNDVVMAQASDGYWYAYVADSDMVIAADEADALADTNLEFGLACSGETANIISANNLTTFNQVHDVWFPVTGFETATDPDKSQTDCGTTILTGVDGTEENFILQGAKTH